MLMKLYTFFLFNDFGKHTKQVAAAAVIVVVVIVIVTALFFVTNFEVLFFLQIVLLQLGS